MSLRLTDSFREDLGLNSLDAVELIFRVEEAFDLMIPDEDVPKLTTVGHIVDYVEKRVLPTDPPAKGLGPAAQASTSGTRQARASASRRSKSKKTRA